MPSLQYNDIIPAASFAEIDLQWVPVSSVLGRWVQCMWLAFESRCGDLPFREKLYPDAGSSLTFEISDSAADVALFHHAQVCTHSWDLRKRYISVRLRAGAPLALFGIHVDGKENLQLQVPRTDALKTLLDTLPRASAAAQAGAIEDWLEALCERADNGVQKWSQLLTSAFASLTPPQLLAEQFGLSRRTLERRLRQHVGFSPNQLYGFAQIRHARQQLISTRHDLSDIALHCGFYDQAHFTNTFHERALETPLQYRKRKLSQISN